MDVYEKMKNSWAEDFAKGLDKNIMDNIFNPKEKQNLSHYGNIKVAKIIKKEISSCYYNCPYFGLDDGPSSPMICEHPKAENCGHIISWDDDIQNGFPHDCPLFKQERG